MDFESDEQRKAVMAKLRNDGLIYSWLDDKYSTNSFNWPKTVTNQKLIGFSKKILASKVPKKDKAKTVQCLYCNKLFTTINGRNDHIKCMHSKNDEDLKCAYCNKLFITIEGRNDHIRDVHPERFDENIHQLYFMCKKCGEKFTSHEKLEMHLHLQSIDKHIHKP
jgi:5-methylcytosine-specific restriction endonuclease McrA